VETTTEQVFDEGCSERPNRAARRLAWPKRRQWRDRIDREARLTDGAKAWLGLLASRSDDAGKPVWGGQRRMGDQLGRCDRSVRRYRAEAEALGYVGCYRSKPVQDRHTGRWGRCRSNAYYLRLPPRLTASLPAPRRRSRAPVGDPPDGHKSRSHRADSDVRSTPYRGASTAHTPPVREAPVAVAHPKPDIPPDDGTVLGPEATREAFERLRQALHDRPARPGH
jgi:hypothetical protein